MSVLQFETAAINGNQLVLSFSDSASLDLLGTDIPAATSFVVMEGATKMVVSSVSINPGNNTVTLTTSVPVPYGAAPVTVAYTAPSTSATDLQDSAHNIAPTFTAAPVTNNSPAPVFSNALFSGNTVLLSFSDAYALSATKIPAASSFAVLVNGAPTTVSTVAISGDDVLLTLAGAPVASNATVTVAYSKPTTNPLQDSNGSTVFSMAAQSAANDSVLPQLLSAAVSGAGSSVILTYVDTLPLNTTSKLVATSFVVMDNGVADTVGAAAC